MADDGRLMQIEIERERRRRAQAAVQPPAPTPEPAPSWGDRARSAYQTAGNVAGEINAGIMSLGGLMPSSVQGKLQDMGVMRRPEDAMEGVGGAAARMVGGALPFAVAAPLAIPARTASLGQPGIMSNILNDIRQTALGSPGSYLGGEIGAAAGAGAAGEMARQEGAGSGGQLMAELGGAVAGGLPAAIPGSIRGLSQGITSNLAPMTNEGGMVRAARQMQERAGGAERAGVLAREMDSVPQGVTPAQWIGDERLMAQEARMLADNPELSVRVKQELEEARVIAQENLVDAAGRPRSRPEWERSVLELVTPEGTAIQPGMSDEMLNQAYQSFRPLYDQAKGHPVSATGLRRSILATAKDPEIIATSGERGAVEGWLSNQYSAIGRRVSRDMTDSDSLLELRSRIRDERRAQTKRGNMERADLLGSAESVLTQRLEQGLPQEVVDTLRSADSQYRKYKVVENALFNAGDSRLTPEQLSESIRMGGLTTTSRYARGVDPTVQELRSAALTGRDTAEVMGDPRRAALLVRGLDEEGKKAVQADFIHMLLGRAKDSATDVTDAGTALASGRRLVRDIAENKPVMRSLGMKGEDITRVENMAREISRMEQRAPAAVDRLFEDGPASLLQLASVLIGAKSGQRMAGRGIGSSLVLAQYMSNRARTVLSNLTSNQAEKLMEDAVTDPKLYKALLTKNVTDRRAGKEQAQYLESWLLAAAAQRAQEDTE